MDTLSLVVMLLIEMFTDKRERLDVTRSSQSGFVPFSKQPYILRNRAVYRLKIYSAVIYITGKVIERCSLE